MSVVDISILFVCLLIAIVYGKSKHSNELLNIALFWLLVLVATVLLPVIFTGNYLIQLIVFFSLSALLLNMSRLERLLQSITDRATKHIKYGDRLIKVTSSTFIVLAATWIIVGALFTAPINSSPLSQSSSFLANVFNNAHIDTVDAKYLEDWQRENQHISTAIDSVVRIESPGCGGLRYGSGFVIAKNTIMTNAHVVAGIKNPVIRATDGSFYQGRVVYFDIDNDIAILSTEDLGLKPLTIANSNHPHQESSAVAIGYPDGKTLKVGEIGMVRPISFYDSDIYNHRLIKHDRYEMQVAISPGNSGSPVIMPSGEVIGMIDATSDIYYDVGYAVTAASINKVLDTYQDIASDQELNPVNSTCI
ncbi:MAG: trypsin-like peptidase domain-containing protein [Candidatus Saccharimonadales bacterium]